MTSVLYPQTHSSWRYMCVYTCMHIHMCVNVCVVYMYVCVLEHLCMPVQRRMASVLSYHSLPIPLGKALTKPAARKHPLSLPCAPALKLQACTSLRLFFFIVGAYVWTQILMLVHKSSYPLRVSRALHSSQMWVFCALYRVCSSSPLVIIPKRHSTATIYTAFAL